MKYRVLRDGISQRETPGGKLVDRAIGEEIEVSDAAAPELVAQRYLEPVSRSMSRRRAVQEGKEE